MNGIHGETPRLVRSTGERFEIQCHNREEGAKRMVSTREVKILQSADGLRRNEPRINTDQFENNRVER